jgi:pimeloyl-ACP methyl ester carboxylesterase
MNNFRDAATAREDGCILIGQTVTCDGFAPERSIRIQTNVNRLNDFSTSKGQQKKIVLSQETYKKLVRESPDIKFRRGQFQVLPADGSCHTVENIQICLFPSGYMPGSVMPVVRTENGISVMYLSDFSWSSSLSDVSFPKIDVLVVDVKSGNFGSNSSDLSEVIPLIQAVQPTFVITYSSQDGNARLLAEYIENNLGINASFEEQPVGLAWGGAGRTTTTSHDETRSTSVSSISSKQLIVVVPSENQNAETWESLVKELKEETTLTESEWLIWDKHNLDDWSFPRGISLSQQLKAKIDARWQQKGPFDEVILIGHSLGGILVRQTYLLASGMYRDQGFEKTSWYEYVRRFVLFASPNRGLDPTQSLTWRMVMAFEKATSLPLRRLMPLQDFVKGSAFITNLRINWIRHFSEPRPPLTIVQLLGVDEAPITRNDSIDLEQLPDAFHIDVPDAKCSNIHRIDQAEDIQERYQLIREAILSERPLNQNQNLDAPHPKNHVIFILHGIRASNSGWVEQVKEKIRKEDPHTEVITASYGYFSAFNFVFPGLRQSNIAWFQDEYSYYFAKYPNIDFHFIGHSNGTYILGESLKKLPGMKFKRVYLAGSVLPRNYPWKERCDKAQIKSLCNARSSLDWPVGILCSGLQGVGMRDIGTGGFDGFLMGDDRLKELYYFNGDHGKPLEESNHSHIIQYILTGRIFKPEGLKSEAEISKIFGFFSRSAPFITRLIVGSFIVINLICIFSNFSLIRLGVTLIIDLIIFLVVRVLLSVI